ncbi:DNA mismatch repair endonuclease MutL [Pantoea sp. Nvir]|uniref:DNA mismatch repair endonuclease MutL n=1 Tax=Pantoea sp. Nvir TaxID=2576760 RepID=UPI001359AE0D|nr:DNA mismatch repair endonuclease MutL [Pantoea sp. Nvir]MXP67092.1 DNA mismatch repair endonuclease MutL [Pantoea sp. Nvir]
MSIRILPPQVASQIAAGEIVERPASVVKELVENSIDAGAVCVDIDIENGGAKMIRIRDNGCGISKEELVLALARHATSKIASLEDLEGIMSLGFRGEALASISSVSRLTLTSCPHTQKDAWQVYTEGREMKGTIKPAAHPCGTTLEVLDLFYNTPARRRFMRTEKTEFRHIDEVIRRIALSRFDVAISLSHNNKLVRQYRVGKVDDEAQIKRRLDAICGTVFMKHALRIDWHCNDLLLRGWVSDPAGSRKLSNMQYCYVNGRIIRNKVIDHAIRQAFQTQLQEDQQPAYVLYLEINPYQLDVNVHPAKHEVRFYESRLVHDFIFQGVMSVLQSNSTLTFPIVKVEEPVQCKQLENSQAADVTFSQPSALLEGRVIQLTSQNKKYRYRKLEDMVCQHPLKTLAANPTVTELSATSSVTPPRARYVKAPLALHTQSFGHILKIIRERYALLDIDKEQKLLLLSLPVAARWVRYAQLQPSKTGFKSEPLLIPIRMKIAQPERHIAMKKQTLLNEIGIDLQPSDDHYTLFAAPLPIRKQNLLKLIPELLGYLVQQPDSIVSQLAQWLARRCETEIVRWNYAQALALLVELEHLYPQLLKAPPSDLVQPIEIERVLAALTHE